MDSPINCGDEGPVGASKCETGLDNSPLFDSAVFQADQDVIDQTDVGMTALTVPSDRLSVLTPEVLESPALYLDYLTNKGPHGETAPYPEVLTEES